MKILGIETSCDETAASVVEDGVKVLSNVIASSSDMHTSTGGIIPENAAREQIKSIIPVVSKALSDANLTGSEIDAIAVTVGPGLVGSLLVGVECAKTLSYLWDKPIIPVNHLVAHIYANFVETDSPIFPAIALIVSGGHTDLISLTGHGEIELLGTTLDDAAGEAFDKCARLLGLHYPGGPSLAKSAEKVLSKERKFDFFPRPLIFDKSLNFSFSGLKTAVLREVDKKEINEERKSVLAAEIQEAIVDSLINKTLKAVTNLRPKSLLLSGGVAANTRLREKFADEITAKEINVVLHVPQTKYCTDNAVVVASCAFFNNHKTDWKEIVVNPELTITDLAFQ